ncbi:hypothetical protein [Streptomyces vinaceus]|uniref:hypothetical protein n=1 Tax=Streptomyces vinaceus TaxID=1960 RepID=UPI0036B8F6A5
MGDDLADGPARAQAGGVPVLRAQCVEEIGQLAAFGGDGGLDGGLASGLLVWGRRYERAAGRAARPGADLPAARDRAIRARIALAWSSGGPASPAAKVLLDSLGRRLRESL